MYVSFFSFLTRYIGFDYSKNISNAIFKNYICPKVGNTLGNGEFHIC